MRRKVGSPHFSAYYGYKYLGEKSRMKNEFVLAFNEVLEAKGLPKEIILDALSSALVSAYRKSVNASSAQEILADIDLNSGNLRIMAEKEVVEEVQDERTEVTLEIAREFDADAELGDIVIVDSTPEDFGRVAAQTARQVIQQKIRDAEKQIQLEYYGKQLGEIVSGVIQAVNSRGLTIGLELKAEGTMPRKEMIPHERFRVHDRVRALVAEVKDVGRGPQIILSRTHRDYLKRLLENEVPEIFHGIVEIRSIAREPGQRAKVAVSAAQKGVDPVGACVGQRGVRIQAIVRELHDEKIDVIEWNTDLTVFIAKAISPARVNGVYLKETTNDGKTALVVVPEDQLSLAIGRDGQNARLAAKLTGWRIDIKSLPEAVSDWLFALKNEERLKDTAKAMTEEIRQVEDIMARKVEGRVLNLEDYDYLSLFVDSLEKKLLAKRKAKREAIKQVKEEVIDQLPEGSFEFNLINSDLPANVISVLGEAGIENAGDLAIIVKTEPDRLTDLSGIGPKYLEKIQEFIASLPEIVPSIVPAVEQIEEQVPVLSEEQKQPSEAIESPEIEEEVKITEESISESKAEEIILEPQISQIDTDEKVDEKEELSFEEMFTLRPEAFKSEAIDDEKLDEDEGDDESSITPSKKKRKKQKNYREIEYDPDLDMTFSRKKHKRGDDEMDWKK